jgi:asparagine synthetase B (glutamine-hydrolysing)
MPEAAAELEVGGAQFRTCSDTEVLLEGWRAWGPALLDRLRGMLALAPYDRRSAQLVLVRGHRGIKPLFYRHAPATGSVAFASELRALVDLPDVTYRGRPEPLRRQVGGPRCVRLERLRPHPRPYAEAGPQEGRRAMAAQRRHPPAKPSFGMPQRAWTIRDVRETISDLFPRASGTGRVPLLRCRTRDHPGQGVARGGPRPIWRSGRSSRWSTGGVIRPGPRKPR